GAGAKEQEGKTRPCREASARVLRRQRPDRRAASRDGRRTRRLPQGERRGRVPSPDRRVCRLSRRRRRPRRAFEAHAGGPGRRSQCRRILPDHPYPVQQHQSLACRHSSRRQRQAPAALSSGMVLPVQSPQLARRIGRLPHSARRRVRHHHLRSAKDRNPARWRQPCPAGSRGGCATCSNWIGIKAELSGLIKKLADLGIVGTGEVNHATYEGVVQQELATTLKDIRECKLKTLEILKGLLTPSAVTAAPPPRRSR